MVPGGRIGPAVSSTCTYPLTNRPEDVWAARMNDWFKTDYCLDMYYDGEYPGYYMRYLEERGIVPKTGAGDREILMGARMDYIAVNYYRTLCVSYLPATGGMCLGNGHFQSTRWILTSMDISGMLRMNTWKPAHTVRRLTPWG